MNTAIDTMKNQARALAAYLKLQEGFVLHHSRCLHAIAAMHGYRDWHDVSVVHNRGSQGDDTVELASSMADQASRLDEHFESTFSFRLGDAKEATAAIRWGALVDDLNDATQDALAIRNWLTSPRDEFDGRCAQELIESDDGYELIQRALFQVPSAS